MTDQTRHPEPPDRTLLLWPANDADEVPIAVFRDDALAELHGDSEARWFTPNDAVEPVTWETLAAQVEEEGYPLDEAVTMLPTPEMVGDHPRESGGYCRRCGEAHSEPEWQRIADRATEGGDSGD